MFVHSLSCWPQLLMWSVPESLGNVWPWLLVFVFFTVWSWENLFPILTLRFPICHMKIFTKSHWTGIFQLLERLKVEIDIQEPLTYFNTSPGKSTFVPDQATHTLIKISSFFALGWNDTNSVIYILSHELEALIDYRWCHRKSWMLFYCLHVSD